MVAHSGALAFEGLNLDVAGGKPSTGSDVLRAILEMASTALEQLRASTDRPTAVLGRIRGTGRGVSFGRLVDRLEAEHPLDLVSPFEGSDRVAGAVWALSEPYAAALAKLRWDARAIDLPMHVHEHSDRFIIVLEGRGYYHVAGQPLDGFDGSAVRTVPARERDVFVFTRGVVHTFSTDESPMVLLSCQLPHLPFDDPRQYTLPRVRWTAANHKDRQPTVGCDPAWTVLT
ncbi:MAG: cupin domain-containing protein [Phycisphaera sp.]|nr:MAG: cupin domain-containing protein [Phycisphaera sp.]